MKCEYVTGYDKTGGKFKECGDDTEDSFYSVMEKRLVPICTAHQMFSKPLWEWK